MKLIRTLSVASLVFVASAGAACTADVDSSSDNVTQFAPQQDGGEFELYRSEANGEFRFRLKASNGEIILSGSEGYTSRSGAQNALDSVRLNGRDASAYDYLTTSDGQFRFNLEAANGEILGVSESYTRRADAERGAKTVIGYIAAGPVLDDWTNLCTFELFVDAADEYRFRYRAGNGEIMLKSEGYATERGAKQAIDTNVTHGAWTDAFVVQEASNGEFYFNLVAPNGEVVGTSSETYTELGSAEEAVDTLVEHFTALDECWVL